MLQELINSYDSDINMTEKQLNIISATIELFSEKGYAATSTSEIAKRAGVAEGTIFRHYKTKKDLLLSIPDFLSEITVSKTFLQNMVTSLKEPDARFEDFLRAIIYNRRDFASSNMIIIKILFQEIPFQPELREKISQALFTPAKAQIITVIDRFKEQGQIGNIPSSTIVNLIITSIFGYMFTRYIAQFELDWDDEKDTENLILFIMNGICTANSPVSDREES